MTLTTVKSEFISGRGRDNRKLDETEEDTVYTIKIIITYTYY